MMMYLLGTLCAKYSETSVQDEMSFYNMQK